jgi:phosphonate transport system permease protein
VSVAATAERRWSPPPLVANPWLRWGLLLGAAAYLVVGIGSVHVSWARVWEGLDRGAAFLSGFARPDFVSRRGDIAEGLLESIVMTVTATVIGLALALPVALGAARNLAPMPVYVVCRGIVALSRTFQEVIVAILFVAMFGFGPLAGTLTLALATVGFLAKLLAESIESSDPAQAEAIRATGASWLQLLNYGIQPQVMPRLIGLGLYRLDINFRESAVIGIVGAGGIGATLNTAFDRYEFGTAAAILITIIVIVMAAEYVSGVIRRRVQ